MNPDNFMSWPLSEKERRAIGEIRDATRTIFPWNLCEMVHKSLEKLKADNLAELSRDDVGEFSLSVAPISDTGSEERLKEYESGLTDLKEYHGQYKQTIGLLKSTSESLEKLMENYHSVAHKTSSLHDTCEQLMADQTHLATSAEELRERLRYFDQLDQLTHRLSSPLISVNAESFMQMLNTIDRSMQFMAEHPDYKEAGLYLTKFQQCLSRALSLVKSHICTVLTNAVQTVRTKGVSENEDPFTLYYGLFAAQAPSVRHLMEQIESRCALSAEYQHMLDDVYAFYFGQREGLIGPSINVTMAEIQKKSASNLCGLVRSGCAFLSRLCEDEQTLFYRFFSRPTPLFAEFAARLSGALYEVTRPLVVHVPHLETLAELCAILKTETMAGRTGILSPAPTPHHSGGGSAANEPELGYISDAAYGFARAVRTLLGDVSERLVYRAQLYARNDIGGYQPAPGDLAYPEKLEMMQSIANSLQQQAQQPNAIKGHIRQTSVDSVISTTSLEVAGITQEQNGSAAGANAPLSPADLHGLWYPPVRRTVMCLSKLYKSLDGAVFHGLCQDILAVAIQSLLSASQQIQKTKSPVDGLLFLVKHLLILREQTAPFRIDAASAANIRETSIDFTKLRNAAHTLMTTDKRRLYSFSNNSLLEFILQVPNQISEHVIDSRRALDFELKTACEAFIAFATKMLSGAELSDFLQKATVILEERQKDDKIQPLMAQPFAAPDKVRDIGARAYRQLKDGAPNLAKKLSLYIANRETEGILFAPVKKNVHALFRRLAEMVAVEYSEEERQIIACPSIEQVNLLLSSLRN